MQYIVLICLLVFAGCDRDTERKRQTLLASNQQSLGPMAEINDSVCQDGVKAFADHFYGFVKEKACIGCHDGQNHQAPGWVSDSLQEAYQRTKALIDFSRPEVSPIVIRSTNGHCDTSEYPACSDPANKQEFVDAITAWWEHGERQCDAAYQRTAEVKVPAKIPTDKFISMRWPLANIDANYGNLYLEAEIKAINDSQTNRVVVYSLRKPRIVASKPDLSLFVRGVRIYLNGQNQRSANQFESIQAAVSPAKLEDGFYNYPVLSSEMLTLTAIDPKSDRLSIGIRKISSTPVQPCIASDVFISEIRPILDLQNCASCHGVGGSTKAPKPFMSTDNASLCSALRQYIGASPHHTTPLFDIPLMTNRMDHPKVLTLTRRDVVLPVSHWMRAEYPVVDRGISRP